MKTSTLLTVILLSWIASACTPGNGKENMAIETAEIPVTVQELILEETSQEIQCSGTFTTNDETYLSFKTAGIIEKIFVNEGDVIRKGQLLATLNVTEVDAHVSQAELEFDKAKRNYERVSNLYRDSVATLEQFQNSKTSMDVAARQMETARFNRSYSEIRALSDGVVLKKSASEGQVISSGGVVLQTRGRSENSWVLKVGISDREWSVIQLGDKASISIDAASGKTYAARVIRKSGGTDSNTGAFSAELQLTGTLPDAMASGMFGRAAITPSSTKKVWSIPYEALLDAGSRSGFVFVTNDMKTAQLREVTIASIETNRITIDGGLEDVHSIIVSGSAYLKDNSAIRVAKEQHAEYSVVD